MKWTILLLCICGIFSKTGAVCTFPSYLTGDWISSDKGILTFNTTHVRQYKVYSSGYLTFECDSNVNWDYILRSTEAIDPIGSSTLYLDVYICLKLVKISNTKFLYYLGSDEVPQLGNERVVVYASGQKATFNGVCHRSNYATTTYHILLKYSITVTSYPIHAGTKLYPDDRVWLLFSQYVNQFGSQFKQSDDLASSVIDCPSIISGAYTYISNNGNNCTGNSKLDVCADKSLLSFNYTLCATQQGYSATGKLQCIYYISKNGVTYLSVYNTDTTTDESSTYRFTCYVLSADGNIVTATQYPRQCFDNQTNLYAPSPGMTVQFEKRNDCGSAEETTDNIVAIICVFLTLLFALFVVGGLVAYKKDGPIRRKCRKNKLVPINSIVTETALSKADHYITSPDKDAAYPETLKITERFQPERFDCSDSSSSSDEDEEPKIKANAAFVGLRTNYAWADNNVSSGNNACNEGRSGCTDVSNNQRTSKHIPAVDSLYKETSTSEVPPPFVYMTPTLTENDSRGHSRVRVVKSVRFEENPQIYSIEPDINDSLLTLFEREFDEHVATDGKENNESILTSVEAFSVRAHTPIINMTTSPPVCAEATTMTEDKWSASTDDDQDSTTYDDDFESSNSSTFSSSTSSPSLSSSFSSLSSSQNDEYEITSSDIDCKTSELSSADEGEKQVTSAKEIISRKKRGTTYTTLQRKENLTRISFIKEKLGEIEGLKITTNALKSKTNENGEIVC